MRTTVSIDDHLLAAVRERAQIRRQTLSEVVEEALRAELARSSQASRPGVPVFIGGTGARPGIDMRSNRAILEALDEGLGLDQLR